VAGIARATTAVIDFNTTSNTSNATVITNGPNGTVTHLNVGGRNAVQTGGTVDNEFLYVALPKDLFAHSTSAWAVVEYYDQGTGAFQLHFDSNGTDTAAEANPVAKHDTKAWTTHTFKLAHFGFTQAGPGGADIWLDDTATDPLIVDKITVTDQDPDVTHWPHVDPAHPIKIDGVISPGEWDAAYTVTLNTAAQDALAGANWGGPQDFSGTYYYKWDESGLYVRGDVTDATPRLNDQAGDQAWNGDGFEEFLSLDWSDPTHTTYLDGTDFHVFIGLGDTPMWGIEHAPNSSTDDKGAIPAQNLAIKNTDNPKGYQFEFYLPWQFLLSDDNQDHGRAADRLVYVRQQLHSDRSLPAAGGDVALQAHRSVREPERVGDGRAGSVPGAAGRQPAGERRWDHGRQYRWKHDRGRQPDSRPVLGMALLPVF
jgi:hypothetical protein